jgi:hypothetical protein
MAAAGRAARLIRSRSRFHKDEPDRGELRIGGDCCPKIGGVHFLSQLLERDASISPVPLVVELC